VHSREPQVMLPAVAGTPIEGVLMDFSDSRPEDATPVDGGKILEAVQRFITRFVRLTEEQACLVTMWVAHTHAIAAAFETPYLQVNSPEKQSGKTRLLEVLELLVPRPWPTGRATAAVLVRKIDAERPTLLLDESDAAFKSGDEYSEALRGILNSGHREDGKASLCVGQGGNITFKDFRTFCAKCIAGIGKNLPDTVADRSIPIRLQRKARSEHVERFRRRLVKPEATRLKNDLAGWLSGILSELKDAQPELPSQLSDRRQDGLEPLLAISAEAGGDWPARVRDAAVQIFTSQAASDDSVGVRLLADIRDVYAAMEEDKIRSEDLVAKLKEIETSPWADWHRGHGLTPGALSKLLRLFDIFPRVIRVEGKTPRGYLRDSFSDAWERYLEPLVPGDTPSVNATAQQPAKNAVETPFSTRNMKSSVADAKSAPEPHKHCIVAPVTDQRADIEQAEQKASSSASLPSCSQCGSFALYRLPQGGNPVCLTCCTDGVQQ
jgi:hypothetical protein